jgi:TetR/AcrR family transcriptional repressor of mexJK operon
MHDVKELTPQESVRTLPVAAVPHSSRGRERRARILEAATELFLAAGYGDTSVDAILERSGGSKATLYSYFPTKEDLFRAVIENVIWTREWPQLEPSDDARTVLLEYGVQRMMAVFSERHMALLRLIIAEGQRFPDIAQTYYELGPGGGRDALAGYLRELEQRGLLDVAQPAEAAEFFVGMLFHQWYTMLLYSNAPPPTEEDIRARSERVVDRFLEAYRRVA